MKIANIKNLAAKFAITGLTAGAFVLASPAKSQAQQFAVGVQFGHPAYVVDRDDYRYYGAREEFREHEAREAYARRQAYLAHERWEAEQREAYARRQAYLRHEYWEHHFDRDDYRR